MRRRYVYDRELEAMVEIGDGTNHPDAPPAAGLQIIRDIEPYRTAASDVASDNKRPVIGSRSRHRTFLQDNGYFEVGNEIPKRGEKPTLSQADRVADIKRAMGTL
jgi:hypothetical protein